MRKIILLLFLSIISHQKALAEKVAFDSPEGWGMSYMTAASLNLSDKFPETLPLGQFNVSAEISTIPELNEEQQRIGFGGFKSEDLNIFVLTNFHKEYLRNLNIKTKSIYTQPNFMNFENNIQSLKPKNEFTYAGRISKEKGISELIKSFKDSNLKDYVLNIIGTGPMLKQLSDENQIYPNIRFYGEIDNSKVIEIIKNSKAVVTSTKMYEGQPTVLCEASVNKIPSIFPNFGGISEFFPVDYDLSFKQFDYQDLTQKFVYASKNDLSEYGSKNYEFLKSKLNEDFLIKRFNLILDENE